MMTKQKMAEMLEDEIKTDMRAGRLELKKKPKPKKKGDKVYFGTVSKTGNFKLKWQTK